MGFPFLLTLLATVICCSNAQEPCEPANGGDRTCKAIDQCPKFLDMVNNRENYSQQDLDLLKKSECGFEGTTQKVCCPVPCTTPDYVEGTCKSIYFCPSLIAKVPSAKAEPSVLKYLQDSKCKSSQLYSVCCPPQTPTAKREHRCEASIFSSPPDPKTGCCGEDAYKGTKILGGVWTGIDEYPWTVIIEYMHQGRLKLLCLGTLISRRYVLTGAHCVAAHILQFGIPKSVRLGEYDISNEGPDCVMDVGTGEDCTDGMIRIEIERVTAHPDFNLTKKQNDIALVKLKEDAPYTDFIRPICLPSTDRTITTDPLILYSAGWGALSVQQSTSNVRHHVELPLVNKELCQQVYNTKARNIELTAGQLCAGGVQNKDTCKGDAGGPLIYKDKSISEVIGIVSFGPSPCGQPNFPAVYTKVYEYLPWIAKTINDDQMLGN